MAGSDPAPMAQAVSRLTQSGNTHARREALMLWTRVFPGCDADVGDAAKLASFEDLVTRRIAREPMSHLLGYRDFYKHRFAVSAAVLDPRPDTETLVVAALTEPFSRVLDLGTGSGCILLSLLHDMARAQGVGTDLSQDALDVAARNAASLDLAHRSKLLQSDWFDAVSGDFDLIVSNPPYIAASEMAGLMPDVRDYEPRIALTDEADGLTHYRHIIARHDPFLAPGGRLMFEIGPTQGQAVATMLRLKGLSEITVVQDIDGRDRVISARKPKI